VRWVALALVMCAVLLNSSVVSGGDDVPGAKRYPLLPFDPMADCKRVWAAIPQASAPASGAKKRALQKEYVYQCPPLKGKQ